MSKRFVESALSNQHIWDNKMKCSYSTIDIRKLLPVLQELETEIIKLNDKNEQLEKENKFLKKRLKCTIETLQFDLENCERIIGCYNE